MKSIQNDDFYRLLSDMRKVRNASLSLLSTIQKDSDTEYYIYLSSVLMNRSNTDLSIILKNDKIEY